MQCLSDPVHFTLRRAALAFAAPNTDQRKQCEQRIIQIGAFAKIGGVGRQRQVTECGDVACGSLPGACRGCGDRLVAGTHDSSVMRRYTAYRANQVITTTATTRRISKNSTTAEKSSRPQPTVPGG